MKKPLDDQNSAGEIPILPSKDQAPQQSDVTIKKIIRELGLKVTQQRMDILRVVQSGDRHFTAQDVFELVSEKEFLCS